MVGKATFIADIIKGVIKEAIVAMINTTSLDLKLFTSKSSLYSKKQLIVVDTTKLYQLLAVDTTIKEPAISFAGFHKKVLNYSNMNGSEAGEVLEFAARASNY